MKRIVFLAVLALALPIAPTASGQQRDKDKSAFRTAKVSRATLNAFVTATGALEPEGVIDVGTQVAGTVVKLGADPKDAKKTVDFNTAVDEGTVLAQIDSAVYRARVDQAKARLSRAESESRLSDVQLRQAELVVARVEKLGPMVVAATEVARARYEYEIARAQGEVQRTAIREAEAAVKEAELQLAQTTIRAPVKGVILDRRVNLGQAVTPGTSTLFVLAADLKRMNLLAQINEADVALVKPGQVATFTVDAFPGTQFKGTVAQVRLSPTLVKNVVAYTAVIGVDNADGKLLPGMTAEVRLPAPEKKNALVVPNTALNWVPDMQQVAPSARGQYYELEALRKDSRTRRVVWVADKEHVRPVVIRIGLGDGKTTEVLDGDLKDGAEVVVGN